VYVHPDQLSLAIGKEGQNVRLAAKLTGWRIDILEEKGVSEETQTETDKSSKEEEDEEVIKPKKKKEKEEE